MPFYQRGPVRIHYQEAGSGFPLLLIPGGGLNSALASWQTASPFDPMQRYSSPKSVIALNGARSDMKPMVEFWPPPGMTSRGKPEPASW